MKHFGWKEFIIRLQEKMEAEAVPYEPWYEKHKATEEQCKGQRKITKEWKDAPVISIVVPLYHTPELFFCEMIASVQAQTYGNWQLCLADGSTDDGVEKLVRPFQKEDARIVYRHLKENLGIAGNTNAAMALASGDWIAFLDHDDLLAPDALFEAVSLIRKGVTSEQKLAANGLSKKKDGKEYDMIYTDEDKVTMDGKTHFQPHFKPDINIDLLRSNNYITHFLLVRKEVVARVGEIRKEYDGAQDYDFILRCVEEAATIGHVPRILYHWRCHKESTSENPFSKQYAVEAGKRAITDHLKRLKVTAEVTARKDLGFYEVRYKTLEQPLISIIISNMKDKEHLKKCLSSIEASDYTNYEVIVVEHSSEKERQSAEKTLPKGQRICVAVCEENTSSSACNNFGVSFAKGEVLLLLHNDIELIGKDFLQEMLCNCKRSEVGIVGAKLYYPDDTVQHAGMIIGNDENGEEIAGNLFEGLAKGRSGYLHKASLQLDYSAVTEACLMVKREIYDEVGGFEETLAEAFYGVDFCLKVRTRGYLVVYDSLAQAYHYEIKVKDAKDSGKRPVYFQHEMEYMRNHWMGMLKEGDPYYNPNLSTAEHDYSLKDFR